MPLENSDQPETINASKILQSILEDVFKQVVLLNNATELLIEMKRSGFDIQSHGLEGRFHWLPGNFVQFKSYDISKLHYEPILDTLDVYSTFAILVSYKLGVKVRQEQIAYILGELSEESLWFLGVTPERLQIQ